jgi:sugar phosphate isomerase/epimerase
MPDFSAFQRVRLREVLADYQARVVAVTPGLFKLPYPLAVPDRPTLAWMDHAGYEHWRALHSQFRQQVEERLPAACDYANELGAQVVVAFGFERAGAPPGPPPDEVLNCLHRAAERAAAAGLKLALETEAGFWADTGQRTAALVRQVNHQALVVNWDPGNAFVAGEQPYPNGYQAVREYVGHVHFKDARLNAGGEAEYALEGQIDWPGQIRALAEAGYTGFISVETHLRPKVAAAQAAVQRLQALIAAATRPTEAGVPS